MAVMSEEGRERSQTVEDTDDVAALCDDVTLKSGRVVALAGWVTLFDGVPLTPDERREIAAEMIHRWMRWSEG